MAAAFSRRLKEKGELSSHAVGVVAPVSHLSSTRAHSRMTRSPDVSRVFRKPVLYTPSEIFSSTLLAAVESLHDGGLKPQRHGAPKNKKKKHPQKNLMSLVTLHFRRGLIGSSSRGVGRAATFAILLNDLNVPRCTCSAILQWLRPSNNRHATFLRSLYRPFQCSSPGRRMPSDRVRTRTRRLIFRGRELHPFSPQEPQ